MYIDKKFDKLLTLIRYSLFGWDIFKSQFRDMSVEDWTELLSIANQQGVGAIAFEAIKENELFPETHFIMALSRLP